MTWGVSDSAPCIPDSMSVDSGFQTYFALVFIRFFRKQPDSAINVRSKKSICEEKFSVSGVKTEKNNYTLFFFI